MSLAAIAAACGIIILVLRGRFSLAFPKIGFWWHAWRDQGAKSRRFPYKTKRRQLSTSNSAISRILRDCASQDQASSEKGLDQVPRPSC